jgi:hypothetical protein
MISGNRFCGKELAVATSHIGTYVKLVHCSGRTAARSVNWNSCMPAQIQIAPPSLPSGRPAEKDLFGRVAERMKRNARARNAF